MVNSKYDESRLLNFDRFDKTKIFAIGLLLFACLGLGFLGGWLGSVSRAQQTIAGKNNTSSQQRIVLNESQLISEIAKNVSPSVVSIDVTSQSSATDFFGFGRPVTQESAGTGVIISIEGVVITNRHVIPPNASRVSVTLSDGTLLDNVSVISKTTDNDSLDVAFLKINDKKGKELKAVKLGNSSKVQVGDKVVAIGNALGRFQNTVTSGIISGYGRSVMAGDNRGSSETLQNLFQTDAAINEGNSGGPLVNISSEVIGINTAVAGNAQGIGFAIPVNDLNGLISSVLTTGKLQRPYLGIRYISLTDDLAYQLNLSVKRGAYVTSSNNSAMPSVLPGSPAEKAGIKEKDIITKINDTEIDENNSLVSILGRFKVGDNVKLQIKRNTKDVTVNVVLQSSTN